MTDRSKKLGNKDFKITVVIVVLLALLAIGAGVYLRSTAPDDDGSYVPGSTEMTPEIEMLREYVMIDTTAGREYVGAEFLSDYLTERGIEHELIESGPGRVSVYSRVEGTSDSNEGLMLLSHIDVVPANADQWSYGPFEGEVALDRLWGRGTLDMKGTTITMILAFADLAASGVPPSRDVVFLATPDEERGSEMGMKWLVQNRPDVLEDVDAVISEGGLTETVRDRLSVFGLEIGNKNIIELIATADSEAELEKLRDRLGEWKIEPRIERLLPGIDESFRRIAPHRTLHSEILEDVEAAERDGRIKDLGSNYLELVQDFAIARFPVEESRDGYSMTFFLSLLPDSDPEAAVEKVRSMAPAGVQVKVSRMTMEEPGVLSEVDTELYRLLEEQARETWGEDVSTAPLVTLRTATDCRFIRTEEIQCYGLWPFQVSFFESQGVHSKDERLRLDWFIEGVEFMKGLVEEYARRPV